MTLKQLDQSIAEYGKSARSATKKSRFSKASLVGFGAAAAGGLFAAQQADANIVYSGVLNTGFNVSTINNSSTNALSGFYFPSFEGGRNAFGIFGNKRGPANPVGSTDILWVAGASAASGLVNATAPAFPASAVELSSGGTFGGGVGATLAWAAAGIPGNLVIDPFSVGNDGSKTAFFGFSFSNTTATGLNFGWGRINITTAAGLPTSMTLIDYAYDNMGRPIVVGAVPEPSTTGIAGLAALAAGAAGVRRYRKQRQAKAS